MLLPKGPVPKLGCMEHFSGGVTHQATTPAKHPPLPRLNIPGAPCDAHVPNSTAPVVSICCHTISFVTSQIWYACVSSFCTP